MQLLLLALLIVFGSKFISTDETFSSSLNSTAQEKYVVTIKVKTVLRSTHLYDITITNTQDLDNLTNSIRLVNDTVYMFISSPSIQPITLQLKKRELIIAKDLMVRYSNKVTPIQEFEGLSLESCHFTGHVLEYKDSDVTLDMCKGVSGEIVIQGDSVTIRSVIKNSEVETVLKCRNQMICNLIEKQRSTPRRSKRRLTFSTSIDKAEPTRYIELYMIMDYELYKKLNSSANKCARRAIKIAEYSNSLFIQANIRLALVGLEIWSNGDRIPFQLVNQSSPSTYDAHKLVSSLGNYQYKNIWLQNNDAVALLTYRKIDSRGTAFIKQICTEELSVGVISDISSLKNTGTILTHELGHQLGLPNEYYGEKEDQRTQICTCEYEDKKRDKEVCMMGYQITEYEYGRRWSNCSMKTLNKNLRRAGLGECLTNKPEQLIIDLPNRKRTSCGNYLLERGEECDCGPVENCTNSCCNPRNCKLRKTSTCASGPCCNLKTCKIRSTDYTCRKKSSAQCDIEEKCDGINEWCPENLYQPNGYHCNNKGEAFCYNGSCNSHNSQCVFIHGEGTEMADDECYTIGNTLGSVYGNCGWKMVIGRDGREYKYEQCAAVDDTMCGQLYCEEGDSKETQYFRLQPGRVKAERLQVYNSVCLFVKQNKGLVPLNVGRVPNGAKCGDQKMCVNSKCVPVAYQEFYKHNPESKPKKAATSCEPAGLVSYYYKYSFNVTTVTIASVFGVLVVMIVGKLTCHQDGEWLSNKLGIDIPSPVVAPYRSYSEPQRNSAFNSTRHLQ